MKRLLASLLSLSLAFSFLTPLPAEAATVDISTLSSEPAIYTGSGVETEREVINFNNDWRYYEGDYSGAEATDFDDSQWLYVNLPHNTEPYTVEDKYPYLGISWYRKTFTLDNYQGKNFEITFEGVMQEADIYINGTHVLNHTGGYIPFTIDITEYITDGVPVVIAVKADSRPNTEFAPGKTSPDFQYFGGINRDVYITATNPLHITNAVEDVEPNVYDFQGIFITAPDVSSDEATVKVKANVENTGSTAMDASILIEIIDDDGTVVASGLSATQTVPVEGDVDFETSVVVVDPKLWGIYTPDLYTVRTTVLSENIAYDAEDVVYGIRKVEWKTDGLYLNDEKIQVQGANLHSESYMVGNAMSNSAIYEEVKRLKEYGFDAIRMAHYPHDQAFYDACDLYGVLVVDCMSGWQYFNSATSFRESTYKEARTILRSSRNHACIVAWEMSLNESGFDAAWASAINSIVDEEWPDDGDSTAYTAGWTQWSYYDVGLGTPQASVFGTGSTGMNGTTGSNMLGGIVAEYGDWNYGGYFSTTRVTREPLADDISYPDFLKGGDEGMLQQADNMQEGIAVNRYQGADWLGIDFVWDYADYAGFDSASALASYQLMTYCGVVDVYRLPKHSAFLYQSQRSADIDMSAYGIETGPMIYIANTWSEDAPKDEVRIYSNCDAVELFLGDTSLGIQSPDTTIWAPHGSLDNLQNNSYPSESDGAYVSSETMESPPFTFLIPDDADTNQTLRAVGYLDGVLVEDLEAVRIPPQEATTVVLRPESDTPLKLDGSDIRLVWIDIQDENGTVVTTANVDVSLEIEGPGIIIDAKTVETKGGQLAVWVRSQRGEGEITLTAHSDGLASYSVVLSTETVDGLPDVPEGGDADEYYYEAPEAPQAPINLTLDKTATASTEESDKGNVASNANDGSTSTKWIEDGLSCTGAWPSRTIGCADSCTAHDPLIEATPQWIQIDMEDTYSIDTISLVLEQVESNYAYYISVSMDADDWSDEVILVDRIDMSANTSATTVEFSVSDEIQAYGRYLRVTFTSTVTGTWAGVCEIEAYGTSANQALNKDVTCSSEEAVYGNVASNIVDGSSATRWTEEGLGSAYGWRSQTLGSADGTIAPVPQWVQIDLGDVYLIEEISLIFGEVAESNFAYYISVSNSSDIWQEENIIIDRRTTANESERSLTFSVDEESQRYGRYVRLTVTEANNGNWASIAELGVYGTLFTGILSNVAGDRTTVAASSTAENSSALYGNKAVPGYFWMPEDTTDGAWWMVDMECYYSIDNIEMTWNSETLHQYSVELSTDGVNWTLAADKMDNETEGLQEITYLQGYGRYLRINLPAGHDADLGFGQLDANAYVDDTKDKAVIAVTQPAALSGAFTGTAFASLDLPAEVAVALEGDIAASLPVTWSSADYQSDSTETQTITGRLVALSGVSVDATTTIEVTLTEDTTEPEVQVPAGELTLEATSADVENGTSQFTLSLLSATAVKGIFFSLDGVEATMDTVVPADGFSLTIADDGTCILLYEQGSTVTLTMDTTTPVATIIVENEDGAEISIYDVIVANTTPYVGEQAATVLNDTASTVDLFAPLALYDLNGDKIVNYSDIACISPYYGHPVTDETAKYNVDGSDYIDSGDYLTIYRYMTA